MTKNLQTDETPAASKGQRRQQAIMHCARQLMIEEGYAALSLRRVARELGLALSHVQYYFPSREALLRGILEAHLQAKRAEVQALGGANLTAAAAVALRDQRARDSCRLFWDLWALAAQDAAVAELMTRFYADYVASVRPFVQAAAPQLSRREAEVRAVLAVALLEGLSLFRGHGREAPVPRAALDRAVPALLQQIITGGAVRRAAR